jgi:hypothetical protein
MSGMSGMRKDREQPRSQGTCRWMLVQQASTVIHCPLSGVSL